MTDCPPSLYPVSNASTIKCFKSNFRNSTFFDVVSPLIDQIAEEIGRFAVDVLAPLNKVRNQSGCRLGHGVVKTPPGISEAYKSYCDPGWHGLTVHKFVL